MGQRVFNKITSRLVDLILCNTTCTIIYVPHDHVVACVCRPGTVAGAHPCTGRTMTPFVLRVGLRVGPCFSQPTAFSRSHTVATRALAISKRNVVNVASAPHFSARTAVLRHTQRSLPLVLTATVIAGSALGISSLASPSTLHCDGKCIVWMVHSPES